MLKPVSSAAGCRDADWFLPVKAVAAAFRRRFEQALRATAPELHAAVADSVWRTDWNVDVQSTGVGVEGVRYLAR